MKVNVKTKLALIFLAIACFIGVVTSIVVNALVSNQIISEAQERVKEHLSTARWIYNSKIRDIDRSIRWTSVRHVLKTAAKERDATPIRNELVGLMVEEGLDFLTLVDQRGTVIFRFHNPQVSGDNLIKDPFVRVVLGNKTISGTQVLSGNEMLREGEHIARMAIITSIPTPKEKETKEIDETSGMVLKSAYPVVDFDGKVLGALVGGVVLNRNYEIVDQIKNVVFKDAKYKGKEIGTATIFLGDFRISTNVMDKAGKRAIGTRVSAEVNEQVLGKGIPWIHRAFVVNDWYITAYEPIHDIEGNIVGMLYVGMMENKYAVMKERLVLFFFLFSISAMLIALAISFLLSWRILKK